MTPSGMRLLLPAALSPLRPTEARAIRHFAERTSGELTLAHVLGREQSWAAARLALGALADDTLGRGPLRRLILDGDDAPAAIAALVGREPFDLVMCPSAPRPAVARWLRPSFRAELLHRSSAALWTAGPQARSEDAPRQIGWLVDFAADPAAQAGFVAALAARFDARVLLIDVVPAIDEGTPALVFDRPRPLSTRTSLAALQRLLSGAAVEYVAPSGERWREVRRLVTKRHLDLLVVHRSDALGRTIWRTIPAALDRLPCPIVCLPAAPAVGLGAGWKRLQPDTAVPQPLPPAVPGREVWLPA